MSKQKIKDTDSNVVSTGDAKFRRAQPERSIVPALIIPSAAEDRLITAAALSDPDALPMTDAQLRQLRPARPLPG